MKKILSCFFFVFFVLFSVSSQDKSVINDSLYVVDNKLSVLNKNANVLDENLNIVDNKNSVIDTDKSLLNKDLSVFKNKTGIGVYENTVISPVENTVQNTIQTVVIDVREDPFIGDYGKFLSTVTRKNPQAKKRFVQYFTDWQKTNKNQDFFAYAGSRAEREKRVEFCYDAALARFGAGTAITATTWIVTYISPGGAVFHVAYMMIATSTTEAALIGGAIGGIAAAGVSLIQGKNTEEFIFNTINSAADGYLIGAITGLVKGSSRAYKYLKDVKQLKNVPGIKTIFDGEVYSEKGIRLTSRFDNNDTPNSFRQYIKNVERSKEYLMSQSARTQKIVADYTKQGAEYGYERLNGCLRGLLPCNHITNSRIKVLQELTSGLKNPSQIFFRYSKDNLCGFKLQEVNGKLYIAVNGRLQELGGVVQEKGFLSVSSHPTQNIEIFISGAKSVPYRVHIASPKGNPGIFVGDVSKGSQFTNFDEYETIKPPGTRLNIKKYEWNEKLRLWDIFAEEVL